MSEKQYAVITPVRNEAEHVGKTIESMARQSCLPERWVIVDDGSSDGTSEILDAAAAKYPWISVIHRKDRGARKSGAGVIEAFYDGFAVIADLPWQYLVKLDGDLSFEPDYFARCFAHFDVNPRLGIGGGTICITENGSALVESAGDPPFHVRGATKIYRRECWDEIAPLLQAPGWDTIDEVKANMKGWTTSTFSDVPLVQLKVTGNADGTWRNWFKNGRGCYVSGYDPVFMLGKCVKRALKRPLLIPGVALGAGFCSGYLSALPQLPDGEVIRYLRQQQRRRLLFRESIYS
jgi:glycosyltransferase involved in cell wall biosynthesis